MLNVNVRKQGGTAIISIPPVLLKQLGIHIGSKLVLEIEDHSLVARPAESYQKKRYTLGDLLKGVTVAKMKKLNKTTQETRDGKSIGRELP